MSPCPSNTYTRAAQFEGLSAEARYRLQKGGGAIFEMVKRRISDSPPAENYLPLTGGHHHKPQKAEIAIFKGVGLYWGQKNANYSVVIPSYSLLKLIGKGSAIFNLPGWFLPLIFMPVHLPVVSVLSSAEHGFDFAHKSS